MNISEENLNELFETLKGGIEKGSSLATEQLPLIAKEIINYLIVHNSIMMIIGSTLLCIGLYFFSELKKQLKVEKENSSQFSVEITTFSFIFGIAGTTIGSLMFFMNLHSLMFTIYCPRLAVIEYIGNIIK